MRLHGGQEAFLALRRAVVPFGVAQQHDLALPAHRFDEALTAKLPALDVVGGDEADVVVALQAGIEDHDRNLLADRVVHRTDERGFIERREHNAGHAAADEAFDLGHLRVAVVLAQRSAPDQLDARAPCPRGSRRRECSARRCALVPLGIIATDIDARIRTTTSAGWLPPLLHALHRERRAGAPPGPPQTTRHVLNTRFIRLLAPFDCTLCLQQASRTAARCRRARRPVPPADARRARSGRRRARHDTAPASVQTGQSDPIISRSGPKLSSAALT